MKNINNMNKQTIDEILRDFYKKIEFPIYTNHMNVRDAGKYTKEAKDWIKQKLQQVQREERNRILKGIYKAKDEVRKETGSFKYDFCFDLIEDIINKINN